MNALVRKEIRLLWPVWLMTMAVVLCLGFVKHETGTGFLISLVAIGSVLLGVTSFGYEFSHGTFSILLAQPIPRVRLLRIKMCVLAAAMLTICLALLVVVVSRWGPDLRNSDVQMFILFVVIGFGAAFAGGALLSQAARQTGVAFWISILFPIAIASAIGILMSDRSETAMAWSQGLALGSYDVIAFLLACRHFLRAQDLPPASGAISLPQWLRMRSKVQSATAIRSYRPIKAMIRKELQLHQITLFLAGILLVLHIAVLFVRKIVFDPNNLHKTSYELLGIWWLLWFILPLMFAGVAIAEERRQGSLAGLLCLPVRREVQYLIKCAVALGLGVLFGGVMPWLLETIGLAAGYPTGFIRESPFSRNPWLFLGYTASVSTAITIVGFYASSLGQSVLQTLGTTILLSFAVFQFLILFDLNGYTEAEDLWVDLNFRMGAPLFALLLLRLAYSNFKQLHIGWRVWAKNAAVMLLFFGLELAFMAAFYKTLLPILGRRY
jgi:ABC-type transport system involved in multi-copper enzyme maturation permease subunit